MKTHGMCGKAEYRTWVGMKSRCYNPKVKSYYLYGGRGITIDDSWLNSFETFLGDMGHRPSSKHSIDRIDTNGMYSKDNCRWATQKEQSRNTRRNILLTINGITHTIVEWAEATGIGAPTINRRYRNGDSPKDCIRPVNTRPVNTYVVIVNGKEMTVTDIARHLGTHRTVVWNRINKGYSIEDLMKPLQKTNVYTYNGISRTLQKWADYAGLHKSTLWRRLNDSKWDFERAISTPSVNR